MGLKHRVHRAAQRNAWVGFYLKRQEPLELFQLFIYIPPFPDTHHQHKQDIITDLVEEPVVPNTNPVNVIGPRELTAACRPGIRP